MYFQHIMTWIYITIPKGSEKILDQCKTETLWRANSRYCSSMIASLFGPNWLQHTSFSWLLPSYLQLSFTDVSCLRDLQHLGVSSTIQASLSQLYAIVSWGFHTGRDFSAIHLASTAHLNHGGGFCNPLILHNTKARPYAAHLGWSLTPSLNYICSNFLCCWFLGKKSPQAFYSTSWKLNWVGSCPEGTLLLFHFA